MGGFLWGMTFLEEGLGVSHEQAALRVAMVPLGWVIGCPLLRYLAGAIGRRKPVVQGSLVVMLLASGAIVYMPHLLPPYVGGLVLGIASGAAMVPYTMIKEVNPDNVKDTATGVINFIVFVISAVMTNIFGVLIKRLDAGHTSCDLGVFQHADYIFIGGLVLALALSLFIRKTGSGKVPEVGVCPDSSTSHNFSDGIKKAGIPSSFFLGCNGL